jgi:hypothetical protein
MAPQIRGRRDLYARGAELVTIPGLRRTADVLRCAQETLKTSYSRDLIMKGNPKAARSLQDAMFAGYNAHL